MAVKPDPYWKLKPPPPTPAEELCSCSDAPAIVLQACFSFNPVVCSRCNLEVPPERIGFSAQLAQDLDGWQAFHDAFYYLWLDSGEFETWALDQLSDPQSAVNTQAYDLVSELSVHRPAYYWWFQDASDEGFEPLANCPKCGAVLGPKYGNLCCEDCSIIVGN